MTTAARRAGPPKQPSESRTPAATEPTLLITERRLLSVLEARGLSLGALFGDPNALDNRTLSALTSFAPLVRELEAELSRAAAADRSAGVDVARYSHRLFDRRFLRLPQARFELVGIVNRPDRAEFVANSCGETRLVYRLRYALDAERASKLPLTLGVELPVPRDPSICRSAAARWLEPAFNDVEARADFLRSAAGPLSPELTRVNDARVVSNMQLVRWPSTVRPDLEGHAEYSLRAFRFGASGVLEPARLENTMSEAELRAPASRRALLDWLVANRAAVDRGVAVLPETWLTTRALSVTPRGLHRLANRAFSAALSDEAFESHDFGSGGQVKSRLGLLRRLDELSCPGCHQARSVAGFHLLGEDGPDAPPENSLFVAVSPQVTADLPRRARAAALLLAGKEPELVAPFAERSADTGGYGEACGLGDDASFAGWQCAAGLRCSAIEAGPADAIGQCLPALPEVGDACERGRVTSDANRLRDRVRDVSVESCGPMLCNRSSVGFPGGMCTASCDTPGASCGSIAILDSFNACLGRGDSFLSCIRGNVRPAGLRACDAEHACRDDYVCARGAQGGVCLPPYFVFQLRVDGHSSGLR